MDAPDDIAKILGPNEKVELYIKQKIYHPQINIDSVVFTNERMILRHPHALGLKKDYTDYNYRDIANVVLDKGILRSTIKCTLRLGGEPLALGDLPNSEAEKAYGIIRENIGNSKHRFQPGMLVSQMLLMRLMLLNDRFHDSARVPSTGDSPKYMITILRLRIL